LTDRWEKWNFRWDYGKGRLTMHEFSVVQQLIEKLLEETKKRGGVRVKEIRLRRGSTFAEGPIQQAFEIMSENTPLQDAQLVVEEFSVEHVCDDCGYKQVLTPDDLIGHLYICPECGQSKEIDEAHGLELLEVTYTDNK
jgi:hydrogenase nickel insertion protein HypA